MVKFNDRVVGGEQRSRIGWTRRSWKGSVIIRRRLRQEVARKKLRVMVGDKVSQDSRQDPVPADGR